MNTPAEEPAIARSRQVVSGLLFVALVAAGVVAALWVRPLIWPGRESDAPVPLDRSAFRAGTNRSPASSSSQPGATLPGSLGAAAPSPLPADPTGIVPPAGAKMRWAFRMPDRSVQTNYRFEGELDAAARHYIDAMKRAGYTVLGDRPRHPGRRLVFAKGPSRVTVGLRSSAEKAKIVDIVVTVLAWGENNENERTK